MIDVGYCQTEDGYDLFADEARVAWSVTVLREEATSGYDASSYAQELVALLPSGPAWPTEWSAQTIELLASLAVELARVDARGIRLINEFDPNATSELLVDWEREVGLPDGCVTTSQTVAERRLALAGRLTSVGGQSRAFFIGLAARLGYAVTIDEFRSAVAATAAGISFTGDGWAHTWRVNVPVSVGIRYFRAGSGSAGEPIRSWGNEVLECQFKRFKPAHTVLLFAYPA